MMFWWVWRALVVVEKAESFGRIRWAGVAYRVVKEHMRQNGTFYTLWAVDVLHLTRAKVRDRVVSDMGLNETTSFSPKVSRPMRSIKHGNRN